MTWPGRIPLVAAFLAVVFAFVLAVLPGGAPGAARRPGAWRGLSEVLDPLLPRYGEVSHRRLAIDKNGRERPITAKASLGRAIGSVVGYLVLLGLGLGLLRRRGPEGLPLWPERSDAGPILDVLTVLVPLVTIGVVIAVAAASQRALFNAVYSFTLPLLADRQTLFWPVIRLVVLAPLAEEVLWRGVVYLGLRRRCSPAVAASLTATAFACWHLAAGWTQLPALILHLVFGLAACWLVERTRSLGAAILLHAAGNALALALYALCMFETSRVLILLGV